MKISVAIAAYKGEKYIAEQLGSILPQLGENDEVIVSDDLPGGETEKAVKTIDDRRVKYMEGPGKGVCKNFEHAINACSGDIIFLSDQDDVWLRNKVSRVLREFECGAALVLHDASVTDEHLNITDSSYFKTHGVSTDLKETLMRNTYPGCCMAFRRCLIYSALPFPESAPMHDWWLALVAMKKNMSISVINEPLILWRRHGDNVTGGKTSAADKLRWRLNLARELSKI